MCDKPTQKGFLESEFLFLLLDMADIAFFSDKRSVICFSEKNNFRFYQFSEIIDFIEKYPKMP